MKENEILESLERMFTEQKYVPSQAFCELTKKEPSRFYEDRVAAIKAAHPQLSESDCDRLILRIWLELSMEFDQKPYSYATYIDLQEQWIDLIKDTSLEKIKDVLAVLAESLITV